MSLIQHWKLDDYASSTTIVATVGNDGTLVGGGNTDASGRSVAGPGGSITKGIYFAGTHYIDISAASLSISYTQDCSISLWAKITSGAGRFSGQAATQNNGMLLWSGTTLTIRYGGSENFTTPTAHNADSDWHHFVWVVTGGGTASYNAYMDGSLLSGTQTGTGSYSPTRLGYVFNSSFDGAMAQVKIFTNTLNQTDVDALYAEGTGGGGGDPVTPYPYAICV